MSPLSDCSTGTTRVHLAQSSDVVLKLRTLFVQPSQGTSSSELELVLLVPLLSNFAVSFIQRRFRLFRARGSNLFRDASDDFPWFSCCRASTCYVVLFLHYVIHQTVEDPSIQTVLSGNVVQPNSAPHYYHFIP
ncbi:hypothetical protein YC2023_109902 [Brassica napus]